MPQELRIIVALQSVLSTPALSWLAFACARFLIFLFPVFLLLQDKGVHLMRRLALEMGLAAACAFSAAYLIGELVERARPFRAGAKVALLAPEPLTRFSFPSAHAAMAFALAAAVAALNPRFGWLAFLVATFVSFGRVAIGVHYPTDVLAGALLGIGVWYGVHTLLHQLKFV